MLLTPDSYEVHTTHEDAEIVRLLLHGLHGMEKRLYGMMAMCGLEGADASCHCCHGRVYI